MFTFHAYVPFTYLGLTTAFLIAILVKSFLG